MLGHDALLLTSRFLKRFAIMQKVQQRPSTGYAACVLASEERCNE